MSDVGIILLAAGGSMRMGRPKQLLPFRGTPLLRHAAQVAVQSGLGPVIVVLGSEAERCESTLENLAITAARNPSWEAGMGGSIQLGIETLLRVKPDVKAALITLHDQPLITPARLRELAAAWSPPRYLAVASAYHGSFGVPALFDRALFPKLQALSGRQGAQKILQQLQENLVTIDAPEAGVDVDAPGDYERLVGLE